MWNTTTIRAAKPRKYWMPGMSVLAIDGICVMAFPSIHRDDYRHDRRWVTRLAIRSKRMTTVLKSALMKSDQR